MLFSAPMVRALLDGSKTQTRRVLKQAIGPSLSVDMDSESGVAELSWLSGDGPGHDVYETIKKVSCPHGQPGDQLWVKETHWRDEEHGSILYAADPDDFSIVNQNKHETGSRRYNWKPSIFMPRWASRLTLEITDIRVERLQDISEADAIAEGVQCSALEKIQACNGEWAKRAYRLLWEHINGAGSWSDNPWVWVYTVKKVAQ
jgi:hypothetical protein